MINFNFKKPKVEEVEKYDFSVLTQKAVSKEKGAIAKFEMNKALIDSLNLDLSKEALISIGINDVGMLVLVNTTGIETPYQHHVNKDGSVNSKKLLDRLLKWGFVFDQSVDNEFKLNGYIDDDMHVAEIECIVSEYLNAKSFIDSSEDYSKAEMNDVLGALVMNENVDDYNGFNQ